MENSIFDVFLYLLFLIVFFTDYDENVEFLKNRECLDINNKLRGPKTQFFEKVEKSKFDRMWI